ncbi:MAG TPA: flagellar assembly protein FliW [Planctomycetota bacterium]|nr:flagellar assembly protein FliW [Planctomycetota bacterium]
MMKIRTKKFGAIEVNHDQEIRFVQPVIGFPGLINYVLVDTGTPVKWLQSMDDPAVVFPVVNPFDVKSDYNIEIPTTEAAALGVEDGADVQLWSITVLSTDPAEIRTNLRAPIVLNRRNGIAKQVVLPDSNLAMKYYFVPKKADRNKEVANAGSHA